MVLAHAQTLFTKRVNIIMSIDTLHARLYGVCEIFYHKYNKPSCIIYAAIIWSCLNLIVHGAAIFRLMHDERPIRFKDPDEKEMRAFFCRRGGMEPLEVNMVIKEGSFRRVKAGETIYTPEGSLCKLALLIEGKAHYTIRYEDGDVLSSTLYSGMAFDISLMNIFGVYLAFESQNSTFEVFADTDCLIFEWSVDALNRLACQSGPSVSNYFRDFVLYSVASEYEFRIHGEPKGLPPKTSQGCREKKEYMSGARSEDFTRPLEKYEIKSSSFSGIMKWLWRSLEPFMPPGTRHMALPTSGNSAKNRTMKLAQVKKQADIIKLASARTSRILNVTASGKEMQVV